MDQRSCYYLPYNYGRQIGLYYEFHEVSLSRCWSNSLKTSEIANLGERKDAKDFALLVKNFSQYNERIRVN